ncbi:phage tail tape measure protein [Serratia marcescens]|nr:phage tail tape measure protein [Serratia marcescens]
MADVATLAVALHLNSATFKSQLVDSFKTAENATTNFTARAQQEGIKTADALAKISTQARQTGNQLNDMDRALSSSRGGFEQLRYVMSSLAGGSNIAISSLTNALIPTIDRTIAKFRGISSAWEAQREAAKSAAIDVQNLAQKEIEEAVAARSKAQAQILAAQNTRAAAQASREEAQASAQFYAAKLAENKLYGISVSYQQEFVAISRQLKEAELAETAAKTKELAASKIMQEADLAEAAGKAKLAQAINELRLANQESNLVQETAGAGSMFLQTLKSLAGGGIGIAVMALATGAAALYKNFKDTEKETQDFNAAIMKSGHIGQMTADSLRQLAIQLGGTQSAIDGVKLSAEAGFTGDLLTDVAQMAKAFEDAGGDAQELVRQLSELGNDPLKAMQALTQQGIVLSSTIIQQVAALQRQGQNAAAAKLAQKAAADQEKAALESQNQQMDAQTNALRNLTQGWMQVGVAANNANWQQRAMEQAQQLIDLEKKQKAEAEARKNQATQQQQVSLETIRVEGEINAAFKAGEDPKKAASKLLAEINKRHADGTLTGESYAQTLRGINKLYSLTPKAPKGLSEGQQRLQELQRQSAVLREQAQATDTLTDSQRKLAAFDQEIAGLQGKKLTTNEQSLVNLQGQIRAQLQKNAALEQENRTRQIAKTLQAQALQVSTKTASLEQDAANQQARYTLSDSQYQAMIAQQQVYADFKQRQMQLDKEVTDHASSLYQTQTAFLASEEAKQLAIVSKAAQDKATAEGSFTLGLKSGILQWSDNTKNVFDNVRDLTVRTFDSMTDVLTTFVTTGKASFTDFAKSVLTDISSMLIKMALFNALKAGLSAFAPNFLSGLSFNAKGGVYQSPSLSAFSGQVVTQPTYFAFAKGVGVMGEAGPEAILPLARGADGALGVRTSGDRRQNTTAPTVYITVENGGGVTTRADQGWEEFGKRMGAIAAQESQRVINRNLKPGQPIWKLAKGQ